MKKRVFFLRLISEDAFFGALLSFAPSGVLSSSASFVFDLMCAIAILGAAIQAVELENRSALFEGEAAHHSSPFGFPSSSLIAACFFFDLVLVLPLCSLLSSALSSSTGDRTPPPSFPLTCPLFHRNDKYSYFKKQKTNPGCLKDLLRFLRRDDPETRPAAAALARFNLCRSDLVPLLRRYCSEGENENGDEDEEEKDALALAALKVAAFLTLLPGAPSNSPLWLSQADAAAAAAEAFAAPGALGAAAELAGRALARAAAGGGGGKNEKRFSDADASALQLVLTLCRNLLAAPVVAGRCGQGSVARASAAASLRSRLVARLSESALLDLVLACGSMCNVESGATPDAARALRADAPLLLAAVHAALDGVDAGTLDAALAASEGASAAKGKRKGGEEGTAGAAEGASARPLVPPPRRLAPRGLRAPVADNAATASGQQQQQPQPQQRRGAERELELLRAERTAQARALNVAAPARRPRFGGVFVRASGPSPSGTAGGPGTGSLTVLNSRPQGAATSASAAAAAEAARDGSGLGAAGSALSVGGMTAGSSLNSSSAFAVSGGRGLTSAPNANAMLKSGTNAAFASAPLDGNTLVTLAKWARDAVDGGCYGGVAASLTRELAPGPMLSRLPSEDFVRFCELAAKMTALARLRVERKVKAAVAEAEKKAKEEKGAGHEDDNSDRAASLAAAVSAAATADASAFSGVSATLGWETLSLARSLWHSTAEAPNTSKEKDWPLQHSSLALLRELLLALDVAASVGCAADRGAAGRLAARLLNNGAALAGAGRSKRSRGGEGDDDEESDGRAPLLTLLATSGIKRFSARHSPRSHGEDLAVCVHVSLRLTERLAASEAVAFETERARAREEEAERVAARAATTVAAAEEERARAKAAETTAATPAALPAAVQASPAPALLASAAAPPPFAFSAITPSPAPPQAVALATSTGGGNLSGNNEAAATTAGGAALASGGGAPSSLLPLPATNPEEERERRRRSTAPSPCLGLASALRAAAATAEEEGGGGGTTPAPAPAPAAAAEEEEEEEGGKEKEKEKEKERERERERESSAAPAASSAPEAPAAADATAAAAAAAKAREQAASASKIQAAARKAAALEAASLFRDCELASAPVAHFHLWLMANNRRSGPLLTRACAAFVRRLCAGPERGGCGLAPTLWQLRALPVLRDILSSNATSNAAAANAESTPALAAAAAAGRELAGECARVASGLLERLSCKPPAAAAPAAVAPAAAENGENGESAAADGESDAATLLDLEARAASACGSLCFVELLFWKAPEASAAISRSYDWRRVYGPDAGKGGEAEAAAAADREAALEAAGDADLPDEAELPGGDAAGLDERQAGLLAALAEAARECRDFDPKYAPARDAVFLRTAAEQLGVEPGAVRRQLRVRGLGGPSKSKKGKRAAKDGGDGAAAAMDPEARALRDACAVPLTRREEAVLEDAHFLHAAKGAFFELVADTLTEALAASSGNENGEENGEENGGDAGENDNAPPPLLDPAAADRRRRALLARWRDSTFLSRSLRSLGLVKGRPSRRHEEELRDLYSKYSSSNAENAEDGESGGASVGGGLESMTAQLPGGWRPAQVRRILGNIGLKLTVQRKKKAAAAAGAPKRKKRKENEPPRSGGSSGSGRDSGGNNSASSSDVSSDSSSSDDDGDVIEGGGAAAPSSRPSTSAGGGGERNNNAPSTEKKKRRRNEPSTGAGGEGEEEEEGAAAHAAAVRSALDALRAKRAAAAAVAVAAMREGSESSSDDDGDEGNEAPPIAAAVEKPAEATAAAAAPPPLAPAQAAAAAAAPDPKRRRLKKISTMAAAAPVAGDSDDEDSLDA